jgi:hypothetical protein
MSIYWKITVVTQQNVMRPPYNIFTKWMQIDGHAGNIALNHEHS